MKLRKIIPVTMLTLLLATITCSPAFAAGRTSDEVIRKAYPKPAGYDAGYQKRNKYDQYERNAAILGYNDDNTNNPQPNPSTSKPAAQVVPNTPVTSNKQQAGLSFSAKCYTIRYLRHEVGQDYQGNPCLFYYFTFTNTGSESASAAISTFFTFYQNGIQCEIAFPSSYSEEMKNYNKKVMPGTSIDACTARLLSDYSDVTVEAKELFTDNKSTQVLSLK